MNYKYLKNFYQAYYPSDNVGEEIRSKATFDGLLEYTKKGLCYDYMGVMDSIVRERLFEYLAFIKEVDYDDIYNLYFGRSQS
jgi:hypothetical protein